MNIDFSKITEGSFESKLVPRGEYKVFIRRVDEKVYETGSFADTVYWNMHMEIVEPKEFEGTMLFDKIQFNDSGYGMKRAKHILKELGFDVSGILTINPEDVQGKYVYVTTYPDSYQKGSETVPCNKFPWHAYRKSEQDDLEPKKDENIPF